MSGKSMQQSNIKSIFDITYYGLLLITAIALVLPLVHSFSLPLFRTKTFFSAACFCLSLIITLAYVHIKKSPLRAKSALLAGCAMIIASSVAFSVVRSEAVILFFPSLFYMPGVLLGGSLIRKPRSV